MAIVTFSEIMNDKKVTILNFVFSNCLTFMSDIVNDKKGNNFMNDISGISKKFCYLFTRNLYSFYFK